LRLLIVEDDEAQLRTLAAIMTAEGFEVSGCATAADALECLGRGGFDAAVVDLRLPDMKQDELMAELRNVAEDVPIIIHTGYSSYASARDAVNIGASGYVEKASDPAELVCQVHRAIASRFRQQTARLEALVAKRTRKLRQTNEALRSEIADRKRAEEALRESEERYRALFEGAAEGILVAHAESKQLSFANPAACAMLGYSEGELTRMKVCDLHAGEAPEDVLSAFKGDDPLAARVPFRRKDGTVLYADVNTAPVVLAGRSYNVGFLTDVTARKRAEEEIASLAKFLSENPYPVLRISADGVVLYANSPGCDLLAARNSKVGAEAPPEWRESVSRALATGSVQTSETSLGQCVFALHYAPVDATGYVNVYGVDITQRKEVEEQLRQSQKMEAIGRLAGGVAHDFRNQLTVIKGYAEMLLRRSLVTEEGREKVEEILQAAERSAKFTGQLLAFSRKEILKPEVVHICGLVTDMTDTLRKMIGEDVELSVLPPVRECPALLDSDMFHQALVNLVVNARDAMPEGGKLTIAVDPAKVDASVSTRHPDARPGRYVRLTVTDTGVGMDEQTRTRIFEPFFTTKEAGEGTGLGLSMVHGFVIQSGGFVEVHSAPGKGSTFRLYFPAADADAGSEARRSDGEEARGGTETILVVEDEELLRQMVVACLRESGYTVLEAANARQALHLAEQHAGRIDLLITDVVMPGMSGAELARRFRDARREMPILFISGYGGKELSQRGIDEGQLDVLCKPFGHDELLLAVRLALDAQKATPTDA